MYGKISLLGLIICPAVSFVSFLQEKKSFPSFLFRRKKRSACTGSAGPQTDGRRHILRCRRSEYHSGYASLLRLVFAHVRRACASAFPCKPTTQKKINCGAAFLLCSCRFRQRAAQNGRFKCEPSVFLFRAGHAGKHLFTDKSTAPQCLLFLFFKKRNRSPSFLFRRKEAKENHLPDWFLRFSLHFAQSCCTKRTAHIRAGRFFVASWMCEKRLFYACYPQPLCLLFLFFKKRNRPPSFLFRRKEIVP